MEGEPRTHDANIASSQTYAKASDVGGELQIPLTFEKYDQSSVRLETKASNGIHSTMNQRTGLNVGKCTSSPRQMGGGGIDHHMIN